jgi:hypothetical protein
MEEIYITDGIWLRQAQNKHKILKNLNQDITESGNIKCLLDIDNLIIKPYGLTRNVEHKTGTVIARMIMKIMKLKEMKLKQS